MDDGARLAFAERRLEVAERRLAEIALRGVATDADIAALRLAVECLEGALNALGRMLAERADELPGERKPERACSLAH